MEIAARYGAAVRKHERVVGDGIGFDFQRARRLPQNIEASAIDLRLAADAIGVLHALVAFKMALADDGTFEQGAQFATRIDLSLMAAESVDFLVERRVRSHGGIG